MFLFFSLFLLLGLALLLEGFHIFYWGSRWSIALHRRWEDQMCIWLKACHHVMYSDNERNK